MLISLLISLLSFVSASALCENEYAYNYGSNAQCVDVNCEHVTNGNLNTGTAVSINNVFNLCKSEIVTVNMPKVTSIGEEAFSGASALTSVNMPEVTSIGTQAFRETALTSANMPKVTSIDAHAFYKASVTR